jgi:quinoprotein dehydrogenase-associated probable ABC transporter substrate-binding protein
MVAWADAGPGAMNKIVLTYRHFMLAACVLGLLAVRAQAQAPGLGGSVELVDPKVLRICADPRSLPFSNEAHEGFEDKLADLFAAKLGKSVSYTYYPRAIGFMRNTLNALKCDVVMGDAQGDDLVQTTNPYYHAFYALIVRSGSGLDDVQSLEDPRLKGKHIGVIAGTPPATIMAANGLIGDAKPFPLMVDTRYDAPSQAMVDEIVSGTIDAGILWGPIGGYYAKHVSRPLTVIPLIHEHDVPMDFRISMGIRRSDQDWKRTLNRLIAENQDAINKILIEYGVPIVDEGGKAITQ